MVVVDLWMMCGCVANFKLLLVVCLIFMAVSESSSVKPLAVPFSDLRRTAQPGVIDRATRPRRGAAGR